MKTLSTILLDFFVVVAFIVIFLRNTTVVYAGDLQLRFNKTKKMLMIRKYCKGDLFCLKTMPQAKKNK